MVDRKLPDPDAVVPAPKSNKVMLIVIAVNVVGLGGAGAFFFLRQSHAAAAPAAAGEHGAAAMGKLLPIESFIVNLNEAKSTRYLKVTFSLECEEGIEATVKDRKDVIRDRVLTYLSGLTVDDVRGSETKDAIREMLVKRVNDALGQKDAIKNVLFTEFVVQ